jgi:lipoprotein-anchoring transpeptidase ErfK/SrfK
MLDPPENGFRRLCVMHGRFSSLILAGAFAASLSPASAQTFAFAPAFPPQQHPNAPVFQQVMPEEEAAPVEAARPELRRQIVNYPTSEPAGTIVIDTPNTFLYYVLGGGRALRYGIGVGREGFTWSGVKNIDKKTEWPDWYPPAEMIERQPYLPRMMAGGPGNPLGARAMYLGGTVYRIHGTNAPQTIGGHVSSGCIRMMNEDVIDLYERVNLGTKVVVLPDNRARSTIAQSPRSEPRVATTPRAETIYVSPRAETIYGNPRAETIYGARETTGVAVRETTGFAPRGIY